MEHSLIIGASGGIGAALAQALLERDGAVVTLSRSANGLDVTDPASVAQAMGALEGPFTRVIIATGILAPPGHAPEKTLAAIDATTMAHVLAVNTIGPALILSHLPRLLPRNARSTVAVLTARVGSIGDNRMGGWYAYRASKAAANQITHTAAVELARSHKQSVVVALHPGTVATDFTADYPAHRKVTSDQAAGNLLAVMDALTPAQTGGFYDYAGATIPW